MEHNWAMWLSLLIGLTTLALGYVGHSAKRSAHKDRMWAMQVDMWTRIAQHQSDQIAALQVVPDPIIAQQNDMSPRDQARAEARKVYTR